MPKMRIRRPAALILLLSLAVLTDLIPMACSFKKPQAPSWFSTWDLPLINRRYNIHEILDRLDSTNLAYDDQGNPLIRISQNIDPIFVDQNLSVNGASFDMRDSVGVIDIDAPPNSQSVMMLNDIIPVNIGYVPPAPVDFNQPLETFGNYSWVEVEHGMMNLTLFNNLEVDLDTLVVTVVDSSDLHIIGTMPYQNGLSYLETETQSLDISGQTISNRILVSYNGHTPGGVLINAGDQYLESTTAFPSNISAIAAMAETPEIVRAKGDSYEIIDSTKVVTSTISQGTLNFNIFNDTNLPFNIELHSQNFKLNGMDFRANRLLIPKSHSQVIVDISGYNFIPTDGTPNQIVTVDMVNTVAPSFPNQYGVRASDSLFVHVDVSDIVLEDVQGRIEPVAIAFDPVSEAIDLPEGINQAQLTEGYISLTLINDTEVPAFLDLAIDGGGKTIGLSGIVAPKSSAGAPPATTVLTAGPAQTRDFLNPAPPEMIISGRGVLNPDYGVVTVRRGDSFTGEIVFSSALALNILDTISIEPEIGHISIDSRPDNMGENIGYGCFYATLQNHLPFGSRVTIFIGHLSDSTLYDDTTALRLGPYFLSSAQTDSLGIVTQAISSDITDSIAGDKLAVFDADSVFIGQRIELMPTGPGGAKVTGNDFIGIRANTRIQFRFSDNGSN